MMTLLKRCEVKRVVVAYDFDLRTNEMQTTLAGNLNAGLEHVSLAYRVKGDPVEPLSLREHSRKRAEAALYLRGQSKH